MARISDISALLVVPLAPDLTFALNEAAHFFLSRYRVPRRARASLLGTLKRVVGDLPPGRGSARLSLRASGGALRIRLGISRARISQSRLRRHLRGIHPLLEVTSQAAPAAALTFRVPVSERR